MARLGGTTWPEPSRFPSVAGAALPLIMSAYVGLGDAVVNEVRAVLSGRDAPHVIQMVGEMMTAHTTATDMVAAMIAEANNLEFDPTNELASRMVARKRVAGDAIVECARLAIEATGGMGFMRSSSLERLYRDAHGNLFHPLRHCCVEGNGAYSGRVVQSTWTKS